MNEMSSQAKKFIELLRRGIIKKNILPNTSEDYSDFQEQKDLLQYKKFLKSFAYDKIKECEVGQYNGDEF